MLGFLLVCITIIRQVARCCWDDIITKGSFARRYGSVSETEVKCVALRPLGYSYGEVGSGILSVSYPGFYNALHPLSLPGYQLVFPSNF